MPSPRIPSRNSHACAVALAAALAVLTGSVGVVAWPATARAADPDLEEAREHHRKAEAAFKAGRYDEAYREWESGYRLSSRPLFLLNMAHADRKRGDLRGARALYKRYLVMEPQTKLRGEVEDVLAQIEEALHAEEAATPAKSPPPLDESAPAPAPLPTPAQLALEAPEPSTPQLLAAPGQPAPTRSPFYKQWWFWTGAGAAVLLGVVTGAVLLRGDPYTKSGSLGSVGAAP